MLFFSVVGALALLAGLAFGLHRWAKKRRDNDQSGNLSGGSKGGGKGPFEN